MKRELCFSISMCIVVFGIPAAFLAEGSEKREASNATIQTVFSKWRLAEKRSSKFRFSWVLNSVFPPGSLPVFNPKRSIAQSQEITNANRLSLSVAGELMRFTNDGPHWMPSNAQFIDRQYISVYDGTDSKNYWSESSNEGDIETIHKIGFVNLNSQNVDVVDYHLWPILMSYRGLHAKLGGFGPGEWTLGKDTALVQGRQCIMLEKKQGDCSETCWVDVERDCTILRYWLDASGIILRIDTSYRQDPLQGWVPFTWTCNSLQPKTLKLNESSVARDVSYTFGDSIEMNQFQFDFPPQSEITDFKQKIRYIVLSDGSRRIITEAERARGATYSEFLKTASGKAGLPQPRSLRLWYVVCPILIVAAGTLAWWRLRRFVRKTKG